jgi:hypothetical protein
MKEMEKKKNYSGLDIILRHVTSDTFKMLVIDNDARVSPAEVIKVGNCLL